MIKFSKTKHGIKREKRDKLSRSKDQVYVNGYRFVIASQSETTTYLKCVNFRNKCNARANKRKDTGETFITKSQHAPVCVCRLDISGGIDESSPGII